MNRVGVLLIAIASAVTMACGSSDNDGASPTGPSSSTPSTNAPPQSSCRPSAPTNLAVASIVGTRVTLTWSAVSNAAQYLVLVGTTPSSSNTLLTNTPTTSYTWTVSPGTYYARVQANNSCGESNASNEVVFTVAG